MNGDSWLDLKAEIQETQDAYQVTFTGKFLDPQKLSPARDSGDFRGARVRFSVALKDPASGKYPSLESQWDEGELTFNGAVLDQAMNEAGTATFEVGRYTATFPKSLELIANQPAPKSWEPSISASLVSTPSRCGDGLFGSPYTPL